MINWKFGIMESNIRTYKKLYFYKFGKLPKYVLGFLKWLKNNNYIIDRIEQKSKFYLNKKNLTMNFL